MVYKFIDIKTAKGKGIKTMSNQQLADDFHKPVIRKFQKRQ